VRREENAEKFGRLRSVVRRLCNILPEVRGSEQRLIPPEEQPDHSSSNPLRQTPATNVDESGGFGYRSGPSLIGKNSFRSPT